MCKSLSEIAGYNHFQKIILTSLLQHENCPLFTSMTFSSESHSHTGTENNYTSSLANRRKIS